MTFRTGTFRVGVNLTWLVPEVVGGSEEYTMRLLEALPDHLDPAIAVTVYGRGALFEAYPGLVDQYRLIAMPEVRSRVGRVVLEQTWLAFRGRGEDLMHHAGGTVPLVRRQASVLTVHDPQPLDMPENFQPLKRRWLGWALPYSVAAARLVVCPSQFTAERLAELLAVPEHKLRVVPHGHQPQARSSSGSNEAPVVHKGRYLLYPAIAYPHKRHLDAVATLAKLTQIGRDSGSDFDDVGLVFTGRPGPMLDQVLTEADRLGLTGRVHALGRVPAAELDQLYRGATALIFPSAYEGFGNPALEAMNSDCPVIVSDAGALPEVVDTAGLVVPVGGVEGFAAAAAKLLTDQRLADELRQRGRDQAKRFEVGIAARRLAEVYGELAEQHRS